jgi:4-phytase/acid phosphatase
VSRNRLAALLAAFLLAHAPLRGASKPELKYVVIVSRHGVRSPTWDNVRLNAFSAAPWPEWPVPPGNLTPHGFKLIELMGAYYREWLGGERLLNPSGCQDASLIYIHADKDQRTRETARAFAGTLLPGCGLEVHSKPEGQDPLFSGFGTADPARLLAALRERLGPSPEALVAAHRSALDTLQSILGLKPAASEATAAVQKGKTIELTGPLATGSTFSENLLLEYTEGIEGKSLGWGRLTRANLEQALEVHTVYADLMRRTPGLARVRGSNLLAHIERSLDQAVSGKATPGALGQPQTRLLLLSGHDTNLSNLSGMLGLSWKLPGYQPDDTPPGGALIFALWRDPATAHHSLTLRYVAQSLDQMRQAIPLSLSKPPEAQDVSLPGCTAPCSWESARETLRKDIDPAFTAPSER